MSTHPREPVFDLSGGALCLDLANTVAHRPAATDDQLGGYADLVAWSRQAGALSRDESARLRRSAERRSREAAGVYRRAVELRERLYRIFSAVASEAAPSAKDLAGLNGALSEVTPYLEVAGGPEGFVWRWAGPRGALDRMLWPVLRSAADLLTSEERSRVRECALDTCSWLFLDRSRNRQRRWCDMKTCGNRAKARRHYRKKKETARSR